MAQTNAGVTVLSRGYPAKQPEHSAVETVYSLKCLVPTTQACLEQDFLASGAFSLVSGDVVIYNFVGLLHVGELQLGHVIRHNAVPLHLDVVHHLAFGVKTSTPHQRGLHI